MLSGTLATFNTLKEVEFWDYAGVSRRGRYQGFLDAFAGVIEVCDYCGLYNSLSRLIPTICSLSAVRGIMVSIIPTAHMEDMPLC